ncbi:adenosine 3'-phospho 5'-phosphosulfate transporter 1 isoform X2 [Electrophorus electricus]|uniref:adenosine 3'-phospho 5'-phosphosulfate transporter 1 isoform X2 n=1 Tax=Electrophorus electricus TaxID=8005 RepID=UPI0015D0B780|nr:adenosine 3'-phospho 5'-phosphosulfate transporter 1 isoform X2 [Electrophorus electricus]
MPHFLRKCGVCVCVHACTCSVWPGLLLGLCTGVLADAADRPLLEAWQDMWLFRFFLNILGYATFIIPGYFLITYFKRINYLETGRGFCFPAIRSCVFGTDSKNAVLDDVSVAPRAETESTSSTRQSMKLIFCAAGLQGSYLTWGVLQERVMTRSYGGTEEEGGGGGEHFSDSQFLVFMNRILALTVAGLCCVVFKQPRHGVPMYKYSFASLSNILSSWCQYEALKYISFPTQVLAKASKVIPVMLMGKLISHKSYEYWEYFTAALISVGVSMFLLSSSPIKHPPTVTTFSGLFLLAGYITFDSFTSNWQDNLFMYKVSSVQMMFGVNLFSCLFTVGSLLEQGAFFDSLAFMVRHSEFALHAVLLSICSACGQLFIFYTIAQFGAAVFTIIMTLRQALAILLSCFLYGHTVTIIGGLGIVLVFLALFLRVYARSRMKRNGKRTAPPPLQKV